MKPFLFGLLFLIGSLSSRAEENWPHWRGPHTNGTADAKNLPVKWSETENVLWKIPLPWWSGSTPIIWGDRIFLTSPEKSSPETKDQVPREGERDPGGPMLLFLCLNRADGKQIWQRELGRGNELKRKQNMTSPSPVTDGTHVWVVTGKGDIIAFDFDGKETWRRNIQKDYGPFGQMWGYASSPLLHEDRLIIQVLHGFKTDDPSYIFAVDKLTGKTLWKTERPTDAVQESPDSYASPVLNQYEGHSEIVTSGGDAVTGNDPKTGKEIWRVDGLNPKKGPWNRTITSPIAAGGIVFGPSRRNPTVAINASGKADSSERTVLWKFDKGPDVPTPVSDGRYFWSVDDQGVFVCIDVKTGEPTYKAERLAGGTYSASLVMADGKIYATNESAITTVLAASPEFKKLAGNRLDDEYTISTPAIAGDRIYIRTSANLYCIGNKQP